MNEFDLDSKIKMFDNLEKFIRLHNLEITVMEVPSEEDDILLGLDVSQNPAYFEHPIRDLIQKATSPSTDFIDRNGILWILQVLTEQYPAFLYVRADCLEKGLQELDERVQKWNNLSKTEQAHIFEKVNELHFYDSKIVYFLWGKGADNRKRRLSDLWKKGNFFLETCHDYIQWMFPLNEESKHNSKAPVLTEEEITMIRSNERIQKNMLQSLDVMLRFYGLERDGKKIQRENNFEKRRRWWITKNNHNYLRITRILKSLKLCGLEDYAWAFYEELGQIYLEYPVISNETFSYWDIEKM